VITAYATQGTPIRRILTDNGSGYRSQAFRQVLADHGVRHLRTKPSTPRTNGKAEAFIRILQHEWAYGLIYT
jgi:transposase InsO family protein